MSTKNPRVNIVVEAPLYSVMHELATREGISMSSIARNLWLVLVRRSEVFYRHIGS